MSTRALIGEIKGDKYKYIYSHWDGYPENLGKKLVEHYSNPGKVNKLLDLGNISVLDNEIGEKQDFNNRHDGWTLAYHRDGGEPDQEARELSKNPIFIGTQAERMGVEYIYIFKNKKWKCYERSGYKLNPVKIEGKTKKPIMV